MVAQQLQKSQKFFNSINYFRGIAIIIIVMAHSYGVAHWTVYNNPTTLEKFFYSLNLNGSVFFVFISGFLYNHIFYAKFDYQKFMLKKAKYVLLPYLVCSAIPIWQTVFLHDGGQFLPDGLRERPFLSILWFIGTGRAVYAYWYIPMIMLLFAISPAINSLIRSKHLLTVFFCLLPLSMIVHRPVNNMNPLHSLVYFLPVYLLGIYTSIHQPKIYNYLKSHRRKIIILLIALGLGVIQVWIFNKSGNFNKSFFSVTVPDINLLQKILLSFLFLSVLDHYEDADIKSMKKTAETSFAIYFIHPFLINPLIRLTKNLNWEFQGNLLTLLIATLAMVTISMAIAQIFKIILKKNSRYVIGW